MRGKDWSELQALMEEAREGRLAERKERRLRYILSLHTQAAVSLTFDELCRMGFLLLGLHRILEARGLQLVPKGLASPPPPGR